MDQMHFISNVNPVEKSTLHEDCHVHSLAYLPSKHMLQFEEENNLFSLYTFYVAQEFSQFWIRN